MERRKHRRYEFRHDALVIAQGLNPVACELANICTGGMWLENVNSSFLLEKLRPAPAMPVEIHLFLAQPGREIHSRVMASVRRVAGSSVGVRFREPMPDLVDLLTAPGTVQRRLVVTDEKQRKKLWGVLRKSLTELADSLLSPLVEEAAANIEQQLDKPATLREINELRDSRQMVLHGGQGFRGQILKLWRNSIDDMERMAREAPGRADLEVVDRELFEDWLELQVIASEVAGESRNTLFRLNQLLSQLALTDLDERSNPLAPVPLSQNLQRAVFRAGISPAARPSVYRAFRSVLLVHWSAAMESLILRMQEEGLRAIELENLPLNWPSATDDRPLSMAREAAAKGGEAGSRNAGIGSMAAESEAPAEVSRGNVLRLMALARDPKHPETPGEQTKAEVIERLQPLRMELRQCLAVPGSSLKESLEELSGEYSGLGAAMEAEIWDRASLVDRLFTSPAQEARLTEGLRAQLTQLRLPVFRVLLSNPDFLGDEEHPLRDVINDLMSLCLADRSSSKHLERTVSEVIDQLLEADELDDGLFQKLGQRLRTLVQRQEQSFLRNAERLGKTLDGRQRLAEARRAIQQRINSLLAGREVPMILLELLDNGWEQLMVLAELKEGSGSQTLAELFAVVEQLQAWLGLEGDLEEVAFERELESTAVVQMVERELMNLGNSGRSRKLIRRLESQLMDTEKPAHVWLASWPPGELPEELPVIPAAEESRWATRAHELKVGDWVSARQPDGSYQRMRLVWGGGEVYRFVFLTAEGMHEREYGFSDIVDQFRGGDLQRVDGRQIPFVDQGLYDIVQDLHQEMTFRATRDPLTACMQRHEFEKQLDQLLIQCHSRELEGALICFDIDQFSVVNASYGTAAGDALLRDFGRFMGELQMPGASHTILGRLGGNEFGLGVLSCSIEGALDFAEVARQQLRKHRFHFGGNEFPTTVSTSVTPLTGESPETGELLNRSNLALKAAKKAGGDRLEFVGRHQQQSQKLVMKWVSRVDRMLEEGGLALRAQQITPVSGGGDEVYYEILLGLTDDGGKDISPQPFIEAAEQYRRSTRVDRWVLDTTMEWMQRNPAVVASLGGLNINLSGASLSDDSFLAYIESRVRAGLVPADKLCFEITETAAVANLHYAADFMAQMKRLDCRFALDDFGTGLSSYAYLQQLPVDFVKIDGVFIRGLADNLTNYAMVRSINELSHFLGTRTIAEYVEDMETLEALREIRVDFAQGFGIARPRPLESLSNGGANPESHPETSSPQIRPAGRK
ncbi:DUF1631 family protein [Marinobacter sp.]|uniref:DUF1631 family protein n=1 Tax=Marinobacter sp. TaxID=50741 RepID=UPI00384F34E4